MKSASVVAPKAPADVAARPLARGRLPSAVDNRLYFAQVREDPLLEIAALRPRAGDRLVTVSSGGCTALSLLTTDAADVTAVDVNATQNHLVELKAAALALGREGALSFLGADSDDERLPVYAGIRERLTEPARRYWDASPDAVAAGVLNAGVSERFIRLVVMTLKRFVHSAATIEDLLACESIEAQQALYAARWNSRRWRWLFKLLLNRWAFRRAFPAALFTHASTASFAEHFHGLAEHGLTSVPVRSNYFLWHMLTGRYPADLPGGTPPYLAAGGLDVVRARTERLTLVDGTLTEYLRRCGDRSIDGFSLSNICEWMTPGEIDQLFGEIQRTAAPGARLCFRNFVGWTEVPAWFTRIIEDRELGRALIRGDRSLVQSRFAVCTVGQREPRRRVTAETSYPFSVRDATESDSAALVALSGACPMDGDIGLCVDRAPDFFALNRLEGERWRVGVAEDRGGRTVGCIAVAERRSYVAGRVCTTAYVSDLKVHPAFRGRVVADALTRYAREACAEIGGDVPALLTVLAGNEPMERRADGRPGLPRLERVASLDALAIPLLWSRSSRVDGIGVSHARTTDLEEMAALWQRVNGARDMAQVLDAESMASFVERAPGLSLEDYRVARRGDGRIGGFIALWDQWPLKRLSVTSYSARLAIVRRAVNLVAPLAGAAPLPGRDGALRTIAGFNVCVPSDEPAVLRALLLRGYAECRGGIHSLLTIGLDVRDPLRAALRGLLAQPTRVHAYAATASGGRCSIAVERLLHFETALV